MRTKIIIGVVIGIVILVAVVIFINKKSETEDKYIGFWKENQYTQKVTKGSDGYYEIFTVGDSTPTIPDYFGKYDKDKKILIVHSADKSKGVLEDKNSLFAEEKMNKDPTFYECWVYDEKKDQIYIYFKSGYDKGNLDLQEKEYILTRVEEK